MAYTKTNWINDQQPAINQINLNHLEQGVADAHDMLDGKVDKVDGKSLSTNDFTNDYKAKLDNIDPQAKQSSTNLVASGGVYSQIKSVDTKAQQALDKTSTLSSVLIVSATQPTDQVAGNVWFKYVD